jgi:hypothetical protein
VSVLVHKRTSVLQQSLRLEGVIRLCCEAGTGKHYGRLYHDSGIVFKKLFIRYLDFCVQKGLIVKTSDHDDSAFRRNTPTYQTTVQGHKLLELLQ